MSRVESCMLDSEACRVSYLGKGSGWSRQLKRWWWWGDVRKAQPWGEPWARDVRCVL